MTQLKVYASVTDQAEVFVICLSSVPVISANVLALRQPEMIKIARGP